MRLLYHPDKKDISLAGVLYALGDPVRLEIVMRLAIKGDLPCAALGCTADYAIANEESANPKLIAKSTMSHHFRILRESGVLYSHKEGTQLINSLRRNDLNALFPGLLDTVLQSASRDAGYSNPMQHN
jgi:DNA-binding transcriptional ArsR family regulator